MDRALRQISDYSCRLNVAESNPEKKVGEFINFLPVLAYDGSAMRQVNAAEILDIAMAGTSATLLAKRWESALLVNVDNDTLARLLASEEAMDALMRIEGFRSLNADIETIINKSNAVKKAKKESDKLSKKEKKELTDAEKEYKSKRKMIQEKLIKFATRVPVFMYLTDYREYNPVQNSYSALWEEYDKLDAPIPLMNVIRRILEYYFLQLCGYDSEELCDIVLVKNKEKFMVPVEGGVPDYTKYNLAQSMLKYIKRSDSFNDGLHFVDESIDADQYKDVFRTIFDAMEQRQHYDMMLNEQE